MRIAIIDNSGRLPRVIVANVPKGVETILKETGGNADECEAVAEWLENKFGVDNLQSCEWMCGHFRVLAPDGFIKGDSV